MRRLILWIAVYLMSWSSGLPQVCFMRDHRDDELVSVIMFADDKTTIEPLVKRYCERYEQVKALT